MKLKMEMSLLVTETFRMQIKLVEQFNLRHKKDKPLYENLANLL